MMCDILNVLIVIEDEKNPDIYSILLYSDRGSQLFWLVVYPGFLLKLKIDKQNRATTSKNVYQSKKVS